jgi:hypothetical protein
METSADPGQTARMLRLIWVNTGRIGHKTKFVMMRLISLYSNPVLLNPGLKIIKLRFETSLESQASDWL